MCILNFLSGKNKQVVKIRNLGQFRKQAFENFFSYGLP